jgi:hypothetical protein
MNDLNSVSDTDLLRQIRLDADSERKSGLAVIHQLKEISKRRLDARLGYPSLHRFCMEELKYSAGSAWRRIKAMQALDEMPELEEKIQLGTLTLASVSQVENFCQHMDKTLEEKQAIFSRVEGLSKRETEQVLAEIAPQPKRPDNLRALDGESTELRITLSKETISELDQIRDLIAHSHPGASYAGVIAYLAKQGVKRLDPGAQKRKYVKKPKQAVKQGDSEAEKPGAADAAKEETLPGIREKESFPPGEEMEWVLEFAGVTALSKPSGIPLNLGSELNTQPGAIPASVRREVWQRDGGVCQYVCAKTGKRCGARARVQPDHIIPRAQGGGNRASNLLLKCRRHNLLAAIDQFGWEKMGPYLRRF